MLAVMTLTPLIRPVPNAGSPAADLARRLRDLDAAGLELRIVDPGKVVSVYRTLPEITAQVTELARAGRQALPALGWTLELSPVETVLILRGPVELLDALGLSPEYPASA
jgi:hypothetical protein